MRYHIQTKLGIGSSGDVSVAVGDWLGAERVAVRFMAMDEHKVQNLRVDAERLAMIGHPNLGLIEDISATAADEVLVATTLAEATLADSPRFATFDDLLAVVDDVAAALDALHKVGLHHGHISATNIMFRGDRTLLGDTGLRTFRSHTPRTTGQDHRRQDVIDLIGLAGTLTAATEGATGSRRVQSVLAVCKTMTAAADEYTSPRHHLAAFRRRLAEISDMPETAAPAPPMPMPRLPMADEPPLPSGTPRTSSVKFWSRHVDVRTPLVAAAAILLVTAGAALGVRWSSPTGEKTATASADTAQQADAGDATGWLAGVPLESCPSAGAGDAGVPQGSRAVEGNVDIDGDGCPEQVAWSAIRAELTVRPSGADGEVNRFRLGEPGDEFLLGDWDCSGQATPGLYRPSTGETYLFDRWASGTEPATATPGPVLDGDSRPTVSAPEGGCDRITIAANPS